MKLATVFSGIGAPEMAAGRVFKRVKTVFACEIDKFARKSYEAIYNRAPEYSDVYNLPAKEYKGRVTLLIGGSPCQSFSMAGLRKGVDDHRGQLIYQFYRVVDEIRPKVFLFENVKGFRTIDKGETHKQFEESFRRIGYTVKSAVLNTKDYGLPQNRERYFLVGFLDKGAGERFRFPNPIPLDKTLGDIIESEVDEKYYLSEKALAGFVRHDERHAKRGTGFRFKPKNVEDIANTLRAHAPDGPTDTFIIDDQGRVKKKRNPKLHTVCPTLRAQSHGDDPKVIQWQRGTIRRLTPKECWWLQGFPDWAHDAAEKAGVSDTQRYKQAGNAMSVNVIEAIFRQIKKAMNKR